MAASRRLGLALPSGRVLDAPGIQLGGQPQRGATDMQGLREVLPGPGEVEEGSPRDAHVGGSHKANPLSASMSRLGSRSLSASRVVGPPSVKFFGEPKRTSAHVYGRREVITGGRKVEERPARDSKMLCALVRGETPAGFVEDASVVLRAIGGADVGHPDHAVVYGRLVAEGVSLVFECLSKRLVPSDVFLGNICPPRTDFVLGKAQCRVPGRADVQQSAVRALESVAGRTAFTVAHLDTPNSRSSLASHEYGMSAARGSSFLVTTVTSPRKKAASTRRVRSARRSRTPIFSVCIMYTAYQTNINRKKGCLMSGEPLITIVGNAAGDAELRFLPNGTGVAAFTVAVTPRVKKGDSWEDGETSWFRCTAWREMAEQCAESITKGMRLIVHGRFKTRSYEKDGQTRTSVEIDVDEVGPSLRYAVASVQQQARSSGGNFDDPWSTGGAAPASAPVGDEPPF